MNAHTLVTVHCYAGDALRVINNMPCYLHHGAPVIIFSPADAPVEITGLICRRAGKRAYIGQDSLDRQLLHLKTALEYPFDYFLLNDSDSLCIAPEIPPYLYAEFGSMIWSNEIGEPRPHLSALPKIAMHPPYFLSRASLEKMVASAGRVTMHPITQYIDHYMLQLAYAAGLEHKSFLSKESPAMVKYANSDDAQSNSIRNHGRVMLHPVKTVEFLERWRTDYRERFP